MPDEERASGEGDTVEPSAEGEERTVESQQPKTADSAGENNSGHATEGNEAPEGAPEGSSTDPEPTATGAEATQAEAQPEPEPAQPEPEPVYFDPNRPIDEQVNEILDRKESLNHQAASHRNLRDKLNDETRGWAGKRDELNAKVRELIRQANDHKGRRDQLNKQVTEAKKLRDELNKAANEKADVLNELKKTRLPKDGESLGRVKAKMRQLEYEQMTKVLTPKKEKELIDMLSALQKDLKAKEKAFEQDKEVKDAYLAMKEAKNKAEEQHRAVTEMAEKAQEAHDAMVAMFEDADKFRKEADDSQEKFIAAKIEADKVHHEYIMMVNQIRDYEKAIIGMKGKQRKDRADRGEAHAKDQAELIMDKFKKGEKLSTDDLMTLQKAGLL